MSRPRVLILEEHLSKKLLSTLPQARTKNALLSPLLAPRAWKKSRPVHRIMPARSEGERVRDFNNLSGQKKWGFVIYRCTYGDDAAWARFMEIFHERALGDLQDEDAEDVLPSLDLKVISDPTLDGASKRDVQERFRLWTASEEAQAEKGTREMPMPDVMQLGGLAARYQFCLHVDRDSLESIVTRAPQPPNIDRDAIGYVNVIDAIWEDNERFDDATGEDLDDGEEPIEGCTQEYVGWMKLHFDLLIPSQYAHFTNPNSFRIGYRRPPAITRYDL